MKTNYSTTLHMAFFAYAQKMIAMAVAIYLGVFYLLPIIQKATMLNYWQSVSFLVITLFTFEGILHFGLISFVVGWWKGEVQVTNLLGAVFTFILIAVLGWFATDNLPYFRASPSSKVSLISLDSIRRVHGETEKRITKEYEAKLAGLDSLYLPALSSLKKQAWALPQTQNIYNQSRSLLLSEKETEISKINIAMSQIVTLAGTENMKRTALIESQDKSDAWGASIVSVIILCLSIYSTFVIGIYTGQKATGSEVQSVTTEVQSVTTVPTVQETVVQSTAVQNNITVVVNNQEEVRKSEKRILAEKHILNENLFELDMKDKEKFGILKDKFSISWGTYSEIKRGWKEGILR